MYTFVVAARRKDVPAIKSFLADSEVEAVISSRVVTPTFDLEPMDVNLRQAWEIGSQQLVQYIIVTSAALTIARHLYFFIKQLRDRGDRDMHIEIRVYQQQFFGETPHRIATKEELMVELPPATGQQDDSQRIILTLPSPC